MQQNLLSTQKQLKNKGLEKALQPKIHLCLINILLHPKPHFKRS